MRGAMDAPNAQEVSLRLSEKGYRSVNVLGAASQAAGTSGSHAARSGAVAGENAGGWTFARPVRPEDLGVFFRQLSALVHAGFTVGAALSDLAPRTQNKTLRASASAIARETTGGGSLGAAFARHGSGVFPPHVTGLVHAGETGGFLPFAFEEAALSSEQDAALRQGIWLPKFLAWQSVWSVLLLQPLANRLGQIIQSLMGGQNALSALSRAGHDLLFIWVPVGLLLHLLAEIAGWAWRQPALAPQRDRFSLAVPVMARLAKMRALAAFTRVLRRLLLSGVSVETAYTGAARSVPNGVLRDRLLGAVPILRAGQGLDTAIESTGLLDHDPVQLLVTGQKTGQWPEMLDRVTDFYQDEAQRATEKAKKAQKQAGVLLTILSSGYVVIVGTVAPMQAGLDLSDKMMSDP